MIMIFCFHFLLNNYISLVKSKNTSYSFNISAYCIYYRGVSFRVCESLSLLFITPIFIFPCLCVYMRVAFKQCAWIKISNLTLPYQTVCFLLVSKHYFTVCIWKKKYIYMHLSNNGNNFSPFFSAFFVVVVS